MKIIILSVFRIYTSRRGLQRALGARDCQPRLQREGQVHLLLIAVPFIEQRDKGHFVRVEADGWDLALAALEDEE